MFFKNIFVFAFTRSFTHTSTELETLLQETAFTPLGSTEVRHFGFVEALGKHGSSLVHEGVGNLLICARNEEKIIPPSVIKDMVEDKVDLLEIEQGRSATKKEREQFKEDITFEILPRAFNRITDTHAYISPKNNTIVINASTRGKAEDLLALLRKTLGTLPVTSIDPDKQADETMTEWLEYHYSKTEAIGGKFTLGMEAHFNSIGDSSAIAIVKNQDLTGAEVEAHLDAEKFVTKIALEYDESMSFLLNDDLSIKRIKFFDVIHEQNDDIDSDDVVAKLDADFVLMAGELNRMISDLHAEFGTHAVECLEDAPVPVKEPIKLERTVMTSTTLDMDSLYSQAVEFAKKHAALQLVAFSDNSESAIIVQPS